MAREGDWSAVVALECPVAIIPHTHAHKLHINNGPGQIQGAPKTAPGQIQGPPETPWTNPGAIQAPQNSPWQSRASQTQPQL
eukprot:11190563-Lingulodinium_polyedra.AAC.1